MNKLELPSCSIERPRERLAAFCQAEYAYYDAIPSANPNRIEPIDVLVTVAMNSRVDSAVKVRGVHQGLAESCDPLLSVLPEDANLLDLDTWREPLHALLHAAVQAPSVLVPVATKVLHRKRRFLIPMLDTVVLNDHYLSTPELKHLLPGTQDRRRAATVAMEGLTLFRADLVHARDAIEFLRSSLVREGFHLTPVRTLETPRLDRGRTEGLLPVSRTGYAAEASEPSVAVPPEPLDEAVRHAQTPITALTASTTAFA